MHDASAGFLAFGRENALEDHTKALESDAARALQRGDLQAAKHFIKRDIAFTMGAQGYDDVDSQRLMKELRAIEIVEKIKARATERKVHSAPEQIKGNRMTAAVMKAMHAEG